MSRVVFFPLTIAVLLGIAFADATPNGPGAFGPYRSESPAPMTATFGDLGLSPGSIAFIENQGQWDTPARYVVLGAGWMARFERDAMLLQLEKHDPVNDDQVRVQGVLLRLAFENATTSEVTLRGEEPRVETHNYFLGNDRSRWRTGVPLYQRIRYASLYEGVDVVVKETNGHLEYDIVLAPGADASQVVIRCEGATGIDIEPDGSMILHTALGPVRQPPPRTWVELPSGERQGMACGYSLIGNDRYGFALTTPRPDLPVVIDPELVWSSFLGSTSTESQAVHHLDVTPDGVITLVGSTASYGFPTTPGAYDQTKGLNYDAFISRMDPSLAGVGQLVASTFLGDNGADEMIGVTIGPTGLVYFSGYSNSPDFPTTADAYATAVGGYDAFVGCLSADLSQLLWCTCFGGTADDGLGGLAVDAAGIVTVVGTTTSEDLPTTSDAYDASYNGAPAGTEVTGDATICRFDPNQTGLDQLLYATYVGGSDAEFAWSMASDALGRITVAARTASSDFPTTEGAYDRTHNGDWDGYIMRLDLDLAGTSALLYSTFIGGAAYDQLMPLDMNTAGTVAVAGWTASEDYPVTANAYDGEHNGPPTDGSDGYISILELAGNGVADLRYSTFFGGSSSEDGFNSVRIDDQGVVTAVGATASTDFPTTPDALSTTNGGGVWDASLVRINPILPGDAQLLYATFIGHEVGESAFALARRGVQDVVVAGWTTSPEFPTTPNGYDTIYNGGTDIFVSYFTSLPTTSVMSPMASSVGPGIRLFLAGPNPAEGWISYGVDLESGAAVRVRVFDVTGRVMARLLDRELPRGAHQFSWDTNTANLAAGVYYLELNAPNVEQTRRVVLLR